MLVKPYQNIAELYSHLMKFIDYKEWAEYYYSLTKDLLDVEAHVLELAGGNCKLAAHLKNYFQDITVSDYSFEMLAQCEVDLKRVCCDMRNLPFRPEFDLILSAFDSINYLLTKKSVDQLFKQVNDLLSAKGVFTFDVSLEKNSIKNIKYLNRRGNFKDIKFIQMSEYDRQSRIHINKFTLMLKDGSTIEEVHRQKIYPIELYFELLEKNGFYVQNCYDAFSEEDAVFNSERVQFVAMKVIDHE